MPLFFEPLIEKYGKTFGYTHVFEARAPQVLQRRASHHFHHRPGVRPRNYDHKVRQLCQPKCELAWRRGQKFPFNEAFPIETSLLAVKKTGRIGEPGWKDIRSLVSPAFTSGKMKKVGDAVAQFCTDVPADAQLHRHLREVHRREGEWEALRHLRVSLHEVRLHLATIKP